MAFQGIYNLSQTEAIQMQFETHDWFSASNFITKTFKKTMKTNLIKKCTYLNNALFTSYKVLASICHNHLGNFFRKTGFS